MSDIDPTNRNSDDLGPAIGRATTQRHPDRVRWGAALAAAAAFVMLPALVGCSGDDADDPSAPTSTVAAVDSLPDQPSGVGVPLEPGSNLPPGDSEGERGGDSEMDVDGDGIGDGEG